MPKFNSPNRKGCSLNCHEANWSWLSRFPELDDTDRQILMIALHQDTIRNEEVRSISSDDVLGASRRLSRLRDQGLLEQHGTNKQQTWYSLTEEAKPSNLKTNLPTSEGKPSNLKEQTFQPQNKPSNLPSISQRLQSKVESLPRKVPRDVMETLLLELCVETWWEPRHLADLLQRHPKYIIATFLKPLHEQGFLDQRYPENKHHPHQAYRTSDKANLPKEDSNKVS